MLIRMEGAHAHGSGGSRRTFSWLVLIAFLVYNANLRSISSLDTLPTRLLPISVLTEFDLDLDEFPSMQEYPSWWEGEADGDPYYTVRAHGHVFSAYPVMPALLAVPLYCLPVFLGLTEEGGSELAYSRTEIAATALSKLWASLAVALSVGLLYLTMRRLTSEKAALWIALVYAFATSSWSVSSQGLWQSSMSQPLLVLALYLLVKGVEEPRNVVYAGFPLALAVACRPSTVLIALVLALFVLRRHRARVLSFARFPALVAVLLLAYNLYLFGTWTGGYKIMGMGQYFTYPRWENLFGLLVSPSRGLFACSPVLLFAGIGLVQELRVRSRPLLVYTAAGTLVSLLFYSSFTLWHGSFSYSYRFLVDILPGLCLFFAAVWPWISARRWRAGVFFAAALFSVFVQVVGSFCFPCRWGTTPVDAQNHTERYWDWTDSEFLRCLQAGPVDPEGLQLLRKAIR